MSISYDSAAKLTVALDKRSQSRRAAIAAASTPYDEFREAVRYLRSLTVLAGRLPHRFDQAPVEAVTKAAAAALGGCADDMAKVIHDQIRALTEGTTA
jgi:hypothetical protein